MRSSVSGSAVATRTPCQGVRGAAIGPPFGWGALLRWRGPRPVQCHMTQWEATVGFDVVVIGAGIVGAACAYHAAQAGLSVCVIDRGPLAGGTTGAGEGNLLVSDKEPGPELDLALLSNAVWRSMADVPVLGTTFGVRAELDPKGGLVVAGSEDTLRGLDALAHRQAAAGVESHP